MRRFVARSESRGDEEFELWLGARQGEEETQELAWVVGCLQQQVGVGLPNKG